MKDAIRARLRELSATGSITVERIVVEMKRKNSPLHGEAEWDKSVAHEIYLKDVARRLIRQFYVELNTPGSEELVRVREYQSLPAPASPEDNAPAYRPRHYVLTEECLNDSANSKLMLLEALRELNAFRTKYRILAGLTEVFEAIDKIEMRAGATLQEVTAAP